MGGYYTPPPSFLDQMGQAATLRNVELERRQRLLLLADMKRQAEERSQMRKAAAGAVQPQTATGIPGTGDLSLPGITSEVKGPPAFDRQKYLTALLKTEPLAALGAQTDFAKQDAEQQQAQLRLAEGAQKLDKATIETYSTHAGAIAQEAGAALNLPPDQRPAAVADSLKRLVQGGIMRPDQASRAWQTYQTQGDQFLNMIAMQSMSAKEQWDARLKEKQFEQGKPGVTIPFSPEVEAQKLRMAQAGRAKINVGGGPSRMSPARADKSYQYESGRLDKVQEPIDLAVTRLGRLADTINQVTPQADALVAPELLTVMAGGQGSGLRMNEAEIARIVGGRTNLEGFKAALNKWKTDPDKGLSITPAQREQVRALMGEVQKKLLGKQQILENARQQLINADDPAEHRRITANARMALSAIDSGKAPSPGLSAGTVKMRAPNGQVNDVPADQVEHFKSRGAVIVQ